MKILIHGLFLLLLRWENFYDPESDIAGYEICLGSIQGECDEIDFRSVGHSTTHTLTGLGLRHQEMYYVTVKAKNKAGLATQVTSSEIKIDVTLPKVVKGMSGSSSDLDDVCARIALGNQTCKTTTGKRNAYNSITTICTLQFWLFLVFCFWI